MAGLGLGTPTLWSCGASAKRFTCTTLVTGRLWSAACRTTQTHGGATGGWWPRAEPAMLTSSTACAHGRRRHAVVRRVGMRGGSLWSMQTGGQASGSVSSAHCSPAFGVRVWPDRCSSVSLFHGQILRQCCQTVLTRVGRAAGSQLTLYTGCVGCPAAPPSVGPRRSPDSYSPLAVCCFALDRVTFRVLLRMLGGRVATNCSPTARRGVLTWNGALRNTRTRSRRSSIGTLRRTARQQ